MTNGHVLGNGVFLFGRSMLLRKFQSNEIIMRTIEQLRNQMSSFVPFSVKVML